MEIQDNSTELYLTHADWVSADGWFGTCNAIWGYLAVPAQRLCGRENARPFLQGKDVISKVLHSKVLELNA